MKMLTRLIITAMFGVARLHASELAIPTMLHPSAEGYRAISLEITAWLVHILASPSP